MEQQPQMFLINKEIVVGLLNYLAKRPYEEVASAVQVLSQLQPLVSPPQNKESKDGLEKENKEK